MRVVQKLRILSIGETRWSNLICVALKEMNASLSDRGYWEIETGGRTGSPIEVIEAFSLPM